MFPFSLSGPTLWYVSLYVVTLLLHVVFMSYVLAGSIMLGVAGARGMLGGGEQAVGGSASAWGPVTQILKDWMTFALSAAITAGVAPLLFVQILYQQEYYSANLLLFHRWMAILPVLIVTFYLLYLLKARRIEGRTALQGVAGVLVLCGVLFVAWSWVENHLLTLDRAAWPEQYREGLMLYRNPAILPRLGFWIAGAFPVAGTVLGWQLLARASGVEPWAARRSAKALALVSGASAALACAGAWVVLGGPARAGDEAARVAVRLWTGAATAGGVVCLAAWAAVGVRGALSVVKMSAAAVGMGVFWAGVLMAREAARWSAVGSQALTSRHESVGTRAGLVVFLVFAVVGVGVIGWVVVSVRRSIAAGRA